jgi:hypothetical protein
MRAVYGFPHWLELVDGIVQGVRDGIEQRVVKRRGCNAIHAQRSKSMPWSIWSMAVIFDDSIDRVLMLHHLCGFRSDVSPQAQVDQCEGRGENRLGGRLYRRQRHPMPEDLREQEGRRRLRCHCACSGPPGDTRRRQRQATGAVAGKLWIASAEAAGLERTTIDSYRSHLNLHVVPFIGRVKPSALNIPAVRAFEDQLREAGRSAAILRKVMVCLGSMLADAQERGLTARNVVRDIRGRRKGDRRQEKRQKGRVKVVVGIHPRGGPMSCDDCRQQ